MTASKLVPLIFGAVIYAVVIIVVTVIVVNWTLIKKLLEETYGG